MGRSNAVLEYIRNQLVEAQTASLSDQELLGRFIAQRDESAFKDLLRRHGPMVLRVCQRVLDRQDDVEDVFQATFLALAQKPGSVNRPGLVGSWLYGVAHHLAQKAHRKRRRQHAREVRSPLPRSVVDPLAEISGRELLAIVDEEMASLPESCRESLLCHLAADTGDEAARRLGCSLRTFRRRLREARELLHQQLQRRSITLPATALAALLLEVHRASATVPAPLAAKTAQAAVLLAAGKPLVDGLVSAHGLALVQGVTRAMFWSKVKSLFFAFLLVGGLTAGVGGLAEQNLKEQPAAERSPEAALPQRQPPPPEAGEPGRADQFGDPLPDGALARIGTLRLRSGEGKGNASVALAPDGKTLISVHSSGRPGRGTIHFWDLATGKEQRRIERQAAGNFRVGISPDGTRLATEGAAGEVQVWDLTADPSQLSWKQQFGEKQPLHPVFSPDGKLLACSNSRTVWLLDAKTGAQVQVLDGRPGSHGLTFSADGKRLAARCGEPGGKQSSVCLWDVATGTRGHVLAGPKHHNVHEIAFAPDGHVLATWSSTVLGDPLECRITLWDLATGKELRRITEGVVLDTSLAFSADGRTLLAIGGEHICFWDSKTGKQQRPAVEAPGLFATHPAPVLSPDGKRLVTAHGNTVGMWEVDTGKPIGPAQAPGGAIAGLAFSPDGKSLATLVGDYGKQARLWEVPTGKPGLRLKLDRPPAVAEFGVRGLGYTRDGRLYSLRPTSLTPPRASLIGWDTRTGTPLDLPPRVADAMGKDSMQWAAWAIASDGRVMACGRTDHIALYDLTTGKEVRRLEGHPEPRFLAFSADGQSLVSCSRSKSIAAWDVTTGAPRLGGRPIEVRATSDQAVALSPDGRWLAVETKEDTVFGTAYRIQLWEVASGKAGPRFEASKQKVGSLTFAPDSRTLAVGCADGTVRLWELSTQQERQCFAGHRAGVVALTFSPDGSQLASGSEDTTALLWDVRRPARPKSQHRDAERPKPQALCDALSRSNAAEAYDAIWRLAETPGPTITLLRQRLHPVPVPDPKQVARWLADLDADRFDARRQAFAELEKRGSAVEPALRHALAGQPSLEVRQRIEELIAQLEDSSRNPAYLAVLRGVEVLEHIGTPEARKVLEELARLPAEHLVAREAKAAVQRLEKR